MLCKSDAFRFSSVLCLSYRYRGKIRLGGGGKVVDTSLRPTKEQEIAKILGGRDRFILIALHPPGIWRGRLVCNVAARLNSIN